MTDNQNPAPQTNLRGLTPLESKYLPLAKEVVKGSGFNHPDPRDDNMRLVGFRVPVEIAGLSEALFAIDAIRAVVAAPDVSHRSLWDQLVVLSGYHITRPPTPDHEFVRVCNGDLRKMVELMGENPARQTNLQGASDE